MAKLENKILTKITMGDWSQDGHDQYDEIFLSVNYPVSEIRKAYKESCKTMGVQFNHKEDYVGKGKLYGHIWTDYEESAILPDDARVLREFDILTEEFIRENKLEVDAEDYVCSFNPQIAAELIMRFIAYSMPKDFEYETVYEPKVAPINGWWNEELNVQFGYGLYE